MKNQWKNYLMLLLSTICLPCLLTCMIAGTNMKIEMPDSGVTIEYSDGTKVDLEEFLPYALAGQIDITAETEALKAQAVIARTNIMRKLNGQTTIKAGELTIPYVEPQTFDESFGVVKREEVRKKLQNAVKATFPNVLKYKGKYIEAMFHSVSIGKTVSAEEIYGKKREYLVSVDSMQDVEAKDYMTMSAFSKTELLSRLKEAGAAEGETEESIYDAVCVSQKTENGYVKTMKIVEKTMTGEQWRKLFGLNSTNFYLEESGDEIRMYALGKGQGVGLSQYGASALAKQGWDYQEILKKYYPGAEIV